MGFNYNEYSDKAAIIKVIGIGGGGCNAVNRMIDSNVESAEFITVNTDNQALKYSNSPTKLHIGAKLTKGHGAGGNPVKGEKAAEESADEIADAIKDADMVYVTAGMGGGTGTGAAPVIAKISHNMGILTVGVVTKPFEFEGKRRMEQALDGIAKLRENVDALLVIPNEKLRFVSREKITLMNAFTKADEVLMNAIKSISDLINMPGIVNLDFADVTSIMKNAGNVHIGLGEAEGIDKAKIAAQEAISSPLLETSIKGASGIIINFIASPDINLDDINEASSMIHNEACEDVNLIWGVTFDESMGDKIKIVVIATNFEGNINEIEVAEENKENKEENVKDEKSEERTGKTLDELCASINKNNEKNKKDEIDIEAIMKMLDKRKSMI